MQQGTFGYRYGDSIYFMDREIHDLLQTRAAEEREKAKKQFRNLYSINWVQFYENLSATQKKRVTKILVGQEGSFLEVMEFAL